MKVYIEKEQKKLEIDFSGTADSLIKQLSLNKETVIVVVNNNLVTEDEVLVNSDEVKFLSVVSGG